MASMLSKAKALAKTPPGGIKAVVAKEARKAIVGAAVGTAFGLALRTLRRQMGFSQEEAARACFVSRRSVVGWERGRAPKLATQSGIIALLSAAKAVDKVRGK